MSELVFVGVKGHVAAISKRDGSMRWKTQLKSGFLSDGGRFVTLLVEGNRVYAHTRGELFCLDATTGQHLWNNPLEGLSFDLASLAVEGRSAPAPEIIAQYRLQQEQSQQGSNNTGG